MNSALIVAIVLAGAAVLGAWRTARAVHAHRTLRILLQFVAAALVFFLLFPPSTDERFDSEMLVVLTPGVSAEQSAKSARGSNVVALPGATASSSIERVPDLGTALRRHPDVTRINVVGGGLPVRDLDAARELNMEFDAAPLGNGIVELSAPSVVLAGSVWNVSGRVEGESGGRIELRDPAGSVVASAALAAGGKFALSAQAKHAGDALFALRVIDPAGKPREEVPLPIIAREGERMRVLLLAGAPDPELKYLRRWAIDAGVQLTSRIAVSDGIALRDGTAMLTAETLAQTDVVIVDERAWKALDASAKDLLTDALRGGLGIVLRVSGPLPDDIAAQWQDFGFRVEASDVVQNVALERNAGTQESQPSLSRRAVAVEGADVTPLLRMSDGSPVALWRAEGQGRVAVWWLGDTYRLSLGGDPGRFGTLWSEALTTIARARAREQPHMPADARVNERSVFCDLTQDAIVEQPDATRVAVSIEKSNAGLGCAAFWPSQPGWHTLLAGKDRSSFRVRAPDEAKALAAAQTVAATALLAGHSASESGVSLRPVPMPRWPLFLAALIALAALWWLERGRASSMENGAGKE